MKKQRLFKLVAFLVLCCTMVGCGKENPQPANQTTTIYGTVLNSVTHEPVIGAEVEFGWCIDRFFIHDYNVRDCHKLSSSVSGTDGLFELQFGDVNNPYEGQYNMLFYIYVTCDGFTHYFSQAGNCIGGTYRMDINLYPE